MLGVQVDRLRAHITKKHATTADQDQDDGDGDAGAGPSGGSNSSSAQAASQYSGASGSATGNVRPSLPDRSHKEQTMYSRATWT